MKRLLNIIFAILVIFVVLKVFIIALPIIIAGILIIGIGVWGYIKYTKRKILRAMNQFEEQSSQSTYYNTNINGTTKKHESNIDDYSGPVIDVDYEEVKRK